MIFFKKTLILSCLVLGFVTNLWANRDYSSGCVFLAQKVMGVSNQSHPLELLQTFRAKLPEALDGPEVEDLDGLFYLTGGFFVESGLFTEPRFKPNSRSNNLLRFLKNVLSKIEEKQNHQILKGPGAKENSIFVLKNPSLEFFKDPEILRVLDEGPFLKEAIDAQGREKVAIRLHTFLNALNRRAGDGMSALALALGMVSFPENGPLALLPGAGTAFMRYLLGGSAEIFEFFGSRQKKGLQRFLETEANPDSYSGLPPGEWVFRSRRVYLHPDLIAAVRRNSPEAIEDGLIRQLYAQNTGPLEQIHEKIGQLLRPDSVNENEFRGHMYKLEPVYFDVLHWNPPAQSFADPQMHQPQLLISIRQ